MEEKERFFRDKAPAGIAVSVIYIPGRTKAVFTIKRGSYHKILFRIEPDKFDAFMTAFGGVKIKESDLLRAWEMLKEED